MEFTLRPGEDVSRALLEEVEVRKGIVQTSGPATDRLARVDVSLEVLARLLQFPEGMHLRHVYVRTDVPNTISVIVGHPSLREVGRGEWIPELIVWIEAIEGHLEVRWDVGRDDGPQ